MQAIAAIATWVRAKMQWRLANYPGEIATLNCKACGFSECVHIEELKRVYGADAPLESVKSALVEKCKNRTGVEECALRFYEADIPSHYQ